MRKVGLISMLLGSTMYVVPVAAQTVDSTKTPASEPATSGVAEIVVTAQRRSESLQKVPLAVTALGADALQSRGITSLSKLADTVVPGLVATPYAGAATFDTFSIRGISAPDPATGLNDLGVTVYVDGVPLGRAVGSGLDIGDIERIEVLRGPQGTLFGRNAEGGAIQYVTRRPTGEFSGRVDSDFGNYDARRTLVHVDLPKFANFSIKLSGLINRHDGFTKNAPLGPEDTISPSDHNDFGFYNQKAFGAAVLWEPSPDFNAYYTFDYSSTRFTNSYTVRTGGRTPTEPAFCSVPSFAAICATPASIAANIYANTRQPDQGYPSQSDIPAYVPLNHNRVIGNSLILSWKASDAIQLKSITGYRTLKEDSLNSLGDPIAFVQFVPSSFFDGTAPDVPVGTTGAVSGTVAKARIRQNQFSQEVQLLADVGDIKLTTGLFYFQERVTDLRANVFSEAFVYLGQPGVLTALGVDPFVLQTNPATGGNLSEQNFHAVAHSYAAYGQGTWSPSSLDDHLHVTAGLRFTHDEKSFLRTEFQGGPDDTTSKFKASRVDPAFIVAYDVTPTVNAYGRYSSAYRAGGVNIRNTLALGTYRSEVNKAFELGLKSQFLDRHVVWNVAAFRSRVTGTQISEPNDPTNPASQTTLNASSPVTFYGAESELTVVPFKGLSLAMSYAYLHSKGPDLIVTPSGGTSIYSVPYAPKHQLSLNLDYVTPFVDETRLAFHADYNYTSANTGTPLTSLPLFATAAPQRLHNTDARIGVEDIPLGFVKAALSLYARNIFNSHDVLFGFQTGTSDFTVSPPGGAANLVDPRTYGVQLRVQF